MALCGVYEIFNKKWCNQTVWICSDPHFGAGNLPCWLNDDDIVKNINSKVGRKDSLIILGDCGNLDYVRKLRGYKVLIAGNHDVGMAKYREVFDEVYEGPLIVGEKILFSHEPINIDGFFNMHGHVHQGPRDGKNSLNVCLSLNDFMPLNLNQLLSKGITAKIKTVHRKTIDKATIRKKKRGKNNG